MLGPGMTQYKADLILMAKVKAILSRGETPCHLLDDYVRAALITASPAIGTFLPRDKDTIHIRYVIPIDLSSIKELKMLFLRLPGLMDMGMDGATVNGKNKVRTLLLNS